MSAISRAVGRLLDKPLSKPLRPRRILVINKVNKFQHESIQTGYRIGSQQFTDYINSIGYQYQTLLEKHEAHQRRLNSMLDLLKQRDISFTVLPSNKVTKDSLSNLNPDLVVSAGGDGTFILSASLIKSGIPLIGVNMDPTGSQGHLCVPESMNIVEILDRMSEGMYKVKRRQRARVVIQCPKNKSILKMVNLHHVPDEQTDIESCTLFADSLENCMNGVIPYMALNEVYIGEQNSARVSYYTIAIKRVNSKKWTQSVRQKSSGLAISTGTGSTSWFYTISSVAKSRVKKLFKIIDSLTNLSLTSDSQLIDKVTNRFNEQLLFSAESTFLAYAIRDPIVNNVFGGMPLPPIAEGPSPELRDAGMSLPFGMASAIKVQSRMSEHGGSLCIDGAYMYNFPTGATATIDIDPKSSIATFVFHEEAETEL